MGSTGLHTWTHVVLPAALPFLLSGMKQGWAFAWRSLMAAEIYVTILTGFGLGHLLHYGRELNAMDQVIGVMLIIVVIGLAVDKTLFAPIEQFLHRRWEQPASRFSNKGGLPWQLNKHGRNVSCFNSAGHGTDVRTRAIAGQFALRKKTKEPGFFKPLNIRTIVDNSTFQAENHSDRKRE